MLQLIDGQNPLPPELKDHPLTGNMTGLRECHIGGDLLLVYRLAEHKAGKMVVFIRVGIHAELFE
jgi:mRNA interferase YafQ